MTNFWKNLKKPFFILAPMDDVTDVVFRQIVNEAARPEVFFTEFTNVEGLNSLGRDKLIHRFNFKKEEHPIVAQIWGKEPQNFKKTAEMLVEMGFDGIDINMGCPEHNVVKNGCCSALINNHPLASEIIEATKAGAGEVPVSVKTRIGLSKIETEDWIPFLLEHDLAALTIHGRTTKEMSKVPTHWDEIGKAVDLRNISGKETLIIGNGDVINREEGLLKVEEYGVDGIMIGRGIFTDIWAFSKDYKLTDLSINQRLDLLLKHAELFDETWGDTKNFAILRKFFKIYLSSFEGAVEMRDQFMQVHNISEVRDLVNKYRPS